MFRAALLELGSLFEGRIIKYHTHGHDDNDHYVDEFYVEGRISTKNKLARYAPGSDTGISPVAAGPGEKPSPAFIRRYVSLITGATC